MSSEEFTTSVRREERYDCLSSEADLITEFLRDLKPTEALLFKSEEGIREDAKQKCRCCEGGSFQTRSRCPPEADTTSTGTLTTLPRIHQKIHRTHPQLLQLVHKHTTRSLARFENPFQLHVCKIAFVPSRRAIDGTLYCGTTAPIATNSSILSLFLSEFKFCNAPSDAKLPLPPTPPSILFYLLQNSQSLIT
ncbi:uncharacterized protein MONOS_6928 [Monocercomonoides exilis]|uniref:uncharacterized protein n=1 Tax=Monocercomonoides exilis TaxID=2049356 RepID=UPI0035595DCE|nr:hypothetical protein MONOS_6928 [Monocercomonoides exilis]|eukprot:MONOS_6928.1-p1 / transcript=MONOS_6928.1 / gene=MONOS_6928 / organism=Monocercomonoides_exilis_PA203 / gene_product=unspecified product / transcript_product=unspecified product / location=Mono_scaffold00227:57148-57919(+) / protein_length=193 / sequence_SO=supercontig / SO=protein_coding / is_pseudo=false